MIERTGDWFQTYSGIRFYPYDPRVEDIKLLDIAHHLSHLCRYNGAVKTFYCLDPSMRVLTDALSWVPAGGIGVGDRLVGFDEYPRKREGMRSCWRNFSLQR